MTTICGSIDIGRPVEEVFDTVCDQRNELRYNPTMIRSVKVTDGPIDVGTVFDARVLSRGRPMDMSIEYTAFDRPRLLGSRSVMAGAVAEGTVRCDPIDGGTRFSWEWQVTVPWPARLAGLLVRRIGERREREIWSGLKRFLEGRPS